MHYCSNCATKANDTDKFCKECGAPIINISPDIYTVPTPNDIMTLDKMISASKSFCVEYVANRTGRTNVTPDDYIANRMVTDPEFRKDIIYSYEGDRYVDNTKCSDLPLDCKSWPSFLLIKDAFPSDMADCIASFIKRTRDYNKRLLLINKTEYDDRMSDVYGISLINMDPSKSWSILKKADCVYDYYDDAEEGALELYGFYGMGKDWEYILYL